MTLKHRMIALLAISIFALSGCAPQLGAVSATQEPEATTAAAQSAATPIAPTPIVTPAATPEAIPTPTSSPTPQPDPVTYAIEGDTIVREQGGDRTVIYDVTQQYPEGWDSWLNTLTVQPEALYFTEGGQPENGDFTESEHAIVRIGLDGGDRIVLRSETVIGYLQIVPYGDRIFFVHDGMDSVEIGWAWRDGSGSGWLDLTDYAAHYGVTPYCGYAKLYMEGGMLYADILLYGDLESDDQEHTIRIGTGLLIQHVSG